MNIDEFGMNVKKW